jgi:mono/diheme cytochrome c family protein
MRLLVAAGFLAGLAAVVAGCGGGGGEALEDAATHDPSLLQARMEYRANCAACHGRDGMGATNLYPPLNGPTWAVRNPEVPIRIVLHGIRGELELGGERYMNQMPPLGHRLADQQIARILTYIRKSWGNDAPEVSPATVARVRAETAARSEQYTPEELEPLLGPASAAPPDSAGAS